MLLDSDAFVSIAPSQSCASFYFDYTASRSVHPKSPYAAIESIEIIEVVEQFTTKARRHKDLHQGRKISTYPSILGVLV
jgi:hypothetical protein